jgi:cytochrome c oxidase subunit 1
VGTGTPGYGQDCTIFGIHVLGLSSIAGSINMVGTVLEGNRLQKKPYQYKEVYVSSLFITSLMLLFALPVLAAAVTMLLTDRNYGTRFFDPAVGGDLLLFQHMFWFFGHPEVYIVLLPFFGLMANITCIYSNRAQAGNDSMIGAMWCLAIVGFVVWGHHMFTVNLSVDTRAFFSVMTAVVAIPTGVKVFSFAHTLASGRMVYKTSSLFVFGFLFMFLIGGVTGMMLSIARLDVIFHDTYAVVSHFHYVMALGAVFAVFCGVYHYFPIYTGVTFNEMIGRLNFIMIFIGTNLVFGPMWFIGLTGLPRRVPDYPDTFYKYSQPQLVGMYAILIGVILFGYNLKGCWVHLKAIDSLSSSTHKNIKVTSTNKEYKEGSRRHHCLLLATGLLGLMNSYVRLTVVRRASHTQRVYTQPSPEWRAA